MFWGLKKCEQNIALALILPKFNVPPTSTHQPFIFKCSYFTYNQNKLIFCNDFCNKTFKMDPRALFWYFGVCIQLNIFSI